MKKITSLIKISLLFSVTLLVYACSGDEITNEELYQEELPQKIADYINTNESYSILNDALQGTDLHEWIENQNDITLFAPTNAAFEAYFQENGINSIADIAQNDLVQLLKNHVMNSEIILSDMGSNEMILETNAQTQFASSSNVMAIITNHSDLKINSSVINTPDKIFDNGIVHSVDKVVALSTVDTFINESTSLSAFKDLILQSDDVSGIMNILQSNYSISNTMELTIFAPDNAAVQNYLANLVTTNSTSESNQAVTFAVHTQISSQENLEITELTDGLMIPTMGASVATSISNDNEVSFRTSPFSPIVKLKTDGLNSIQTSNGILLLTDKVLF